MRALLVFAHPDDEVLGCGGTAARLSEEGWEVHALILGEGVTSRDRARDRSSREGEISALKGQALEAASILGIREVNLLDFPDNRFDSVPLLELVKAVEDSVSRLKPSWIFTHHPDDLNVDHQLTFKATITAARPLPGSSVKGVYACEVLSSSEWGYGRTFRPNAYFPLEERHLRAKVEALKRYSGELREYPHPRSPEAVEALCRKRGTEVGCPLAEAFELVRAVL